MTQEKWEDLIIYIQEQFDVFEHKKEDVMDGKGLVEYICFTGPMGKIKLERGIKPLVVGRKVLSSKRPGSAVLEELVYSDSEKVDRLKAYRWDDIKEEWQEINANQISNLNS